MAIALYPGSFDPITYGHLDVIIRAAHLFERVIVAVLKNPQKNPLFSPEQRIQQIQIATRNVPHVEVGSFMGLTVDYARLQKAQVLIRGLRVLSDFEGELQMAHTNKLLGPSLETLFLATASEYSFLSSSLVKEVARFGGDVSHLVPPHVAADLAAYFRDP